MSEPKQFRATATCAMLEGPHFETFYEPMVFECFVRYRDYARLQAEVERLRKAGDDLGWAVHRLKERFWDSDEEANKAVQAWNAAKEGKPSA